jgi:poly-gamma-glutamate synthesis protein (capsule biosynthesis protein)
LPLADGGRLLVFAAGLPSSGVPARWAAGEATAGVAFLPDLSAATRDRFAARIRATRGPRDVVVASLHWGPNWGYTVGDAERAFAHGLVDAGGVDVVFGHSSHHPKAIELHRGKPILYGCGDLVNDYEGIAGMAAYRGDLVLLYRVVLAGAARRCRTLVMLPFRLRRFRLTTPAEGDLVWLQRRLDRECRRFGARVARRHDDTLELFWR